MSEVAAKIPTWNRLVGSWKQNMTMEKALLWECRCSHITSGVILQPSKGTWGLTSSATLVRNVAGAAEAGPVPSAAAGQCVRINLHSGEGATKTKQPGK